MGEADRDFGGNLCRVHIRSLRDLVARGVAGFWNHETAGLTPNAQCLHLLIAWSDDCRR